jgi:7-cyano-7-deazaguanine reductase
MEGMKGKELEDRIRKAFTTKMPPLTLIPFTGQMDEQVTYYYPELEAICPVTGLPDNYRLSITFVPDKVIPELKTLKQYLVAFRDLPISHEHLYAKIFTEFKRRGGIYTIIEEVKEDE